MKNLLAAALLAAAGTAAATPMLDKCLPFAPLACRLSGLSSREEFLVCFETITLDAKKAEQRSCAEELAHARVHKACDEADIPNICAGLKPGANRVMSCLRKNSKKLGKDCRGALKAYDALQPLPSPRKNRKGSAVSALRC